jgi:putative methyltransferase (TIGR04325 family)
MTPPAIARVADDLFNPQNAYEGPFPDWQSASAHAAGYGDPAIVGRVLAATRAVLDGEACFEQDGVAFQSQAPASPVLSALLLSAARRGGALAVLDFGGSLGSHYLRWRRYFEALPATRWHVVEQPGYVEAGRALYAGRGKPVEFHDDIASAARARPSAVLAGSVLQYLESPLGVLEALRDVRAEVLAIDRTPMSAGGDSMVFVQRVSRRLYPASYPLCTLPRDAVAALMSGHYRLLDGYDTAEPPIRRHGLEARFQASIWLRRDLDADGAELGARQ